MNRQSGGRKQKMEKEEKMLEADASAEQKGTPRISEKVFQRRNSRRNFQREHQFPTRNCHQLKALFLLLATFHHAAIISFRLSTAQRASGPAFPWTLPSILPWKQLP